MDSATRLNTPTAIVVGSVVIATGIFFGLRSRPVADPAATPPAASLLAASPFTSAAQPAASAPPGMGTPPATAASLPSRDDITRNAQAALDRQVPMLVEQCLRPSLRAKPTPAEVRLTFNVTFDAEGRQIARGTVEDRATARADVTRCVGERLEALTIPPPGVTVQVDLPVTLR